MFHKKAIIIAVVSFMICVIVGIGILALRKDKIIQTDTATEELVRIEETKEEESQYESESNTQETFTEEVEGTTDIKDVQEDMEASSEDTEVEESLKSKSNQMEEESESQQTHIDDSDIATSDKIPQPTIPEDTQAKSEESSQSDNQDNSQNKSQGESSAPSQGESNEDSAGNREDDNKNPEEDRTGGKLSISYSDKLLLDKSVKTAYLNVQNPSRSDCNIIVKLQMQSDELIKMAGSTNGAVMMADSTYMTIAESAILNPGTKLESLQLTLQGEVQSGTYCAVYFVEVYDRNTGEQKAINALLPIELTVE